MEKREDRAVYEILRPNPNLVAANPEPLRGTYPYLQIPPVGRYAANRGLSTRNPSGVRMRLCNFVNRFREKARMMEVDGGRNKLRPSHGFGDCGGCREAGR